MAAGGGEPRRVLLIEPDAREAGRIAAALRERGFEVEHRSAPFEALRRLREHGAAAVLLATPLGEADWIATAAAVKEGPAAPPLLVLDGLGTGVELLRILPADRAPDAVIARPAETGELLLRLDEALRQGAAPLGAPASPAFPELLVALRARRESGVVEVRADGVCTRVVLRDGEPVFAEGGSLRETLGRMLLRRGALSEAEYVRVIERMTERLMESESTRMGEVLVELGLLSAGEVFEALSAQVVEKIVGCFRWPHFAHAFEAMDVLPADVLAYRCPPLEALVLAGLRAHFGPERLEPLLRGRAARSPRLEGPPEEVGVRFEMTPAERRLLPALDGTRPLEAVRAGSPLDSIHTDQCLAALSVARALTWVEAAPQAARRTGSVASEPRRGVGATAPSTAADPCPRRKTKPQQGDPARMLAQLRSHLARAERSAGAKAGADAPGARIEAERAFRQGMRLLEQSALPGALRAFARALELNADEPEYRMFEAWVEYLIARGQEARALARAKAAACAQRMLERDRDAVRAHGILGQLAYAAGDFDAAERHFRVALRGDPSDREAQRGLRLVERRRAS
jgi:CheY-like chemotaxis protein